MTPETRERLALAILNSDRAMAGFPPLASRDTVPDSEGYLTNADALAPIIDELVQERAADGWQDIATIEPPHDEVVLLYWQDWSGAEYMEATRYSTGERLPNGYSNVSLHGHATHWRPLPAPPAERGAATDNA